MKLVLVDGNSFLFRAYYATSYTGNLMQSSKGIYTNAVFAFINLMDKVLERTQDNILVAFDTSHPTKRHISYTEYKAGRKEMPEELAMQIPLVRKYLELKGIKSFELPGYEADDIIGTLAKEASKNNATVEVFSSDKDLLQLVDNNVTVSLIKQGFREIDVYTPNTLFEKYGLTENQMIDLKALMGDKSDNIPGVAGVGEVTAIKLLQEFTSLENIYNNIDQVKGKLQEKLINDKEMAFVSKDLVTIDINTPLPFDYSNTQINPCDAKELLNFYKELEFKQFATKLQQQMIYETNNEENTDQMIQDNFEFTVINTSETLDKLINSITNESALFFEFSDQNYHIANLWGIGLTYQNKHHFIDPSLALDSKTFAKYLSGNTPKLTFDYKAIYVFLSRYNKTINNVTFDLLLACYLLKSKVGKSEFGDLVNEYNLDVDYDEVIYLKGVKKQIPENNSHQKHICKKSSAIFNLKDELTNNLKKEELLKTFTEVEIPLSKVLGNMEIQGIGVDLNELDRQTHDLDKRLKEIEQDIYSLADEEFNILSSKQLGDILFEKLNLPTGKKTKLGYSTNNDVLTGLLEEHPIIQKIIDYRQLSKLYSTYLIGIKQSLLSDNKIHTIYNQALTATGRLSSSEPNLQNIPTRTNEGKQIRKIFISDKNSLFLSCDYSQIELRVLAHVANVTKLKEAFINNEDIHSSTAKGMFNLETVTEDYRRKAKAINFGIIYGISTWGLANDTNTDLKTAKDFKEKYFLMYPQIEEYMKKSVEFAIEHGYVETIFKRRIYIPEIRSKAFMVREFGKRIAFNAPIQGSAAEIIKIAMVKLDQYLQNNNLKSRLLLQVHDELILEVETSELSLLEEIVPKIMQEAVKLDVELTTSCDVGSTWLDLK